MVSLPQFAVGPVGAGLLAGFPRDADNAAFALAEGGYPVRVVRGARMPTVAAVYDEFAAAMQFPYYFGANRDAFDECLRDWPDGLGGAPDPIVIVRDADALLGERPEEIGWLLEALTDAGVRVLAQVGSAEVAAVGRRWTAAGARVVRIER